MKKQEVRTGGEASQAHGTGSPAEQVKALVDLLSWKSNQGGQSQQAPDGMSDSPLEPHGNGKSHLGG